MNGLARRSDGGKTGSMPADEPANGELYGVIEEMYRAGDLRRLTNSFRFSDVPEKDFELRRDFEQEMVVILAEYGNLGKIMEMKRRSKDELMRFLLRIVKNNVCSETSPYWKKYGRWEYNRQPYKTQEHEDQ